MRPKQAVQRAAGGRQILNRRTSVTAGVPEPFWNRTRALMR
jgi:hypothetical protein